MLRRQEMETLSSTNEGEQPSNDPYYGYQDQSAYPPIEGYPSYEANPNGSQAYAGQADGSQAYTEQAAPSERQRHRAQPEPLSRILSGIHGFDQIVNGGLIRDRVYLLTGPAGAGKTIFSTEFVYNGITQLNENGVYVVLEETPQQLRQNMLSSFGWDLGYLEETSNLVILDALSSRLGLGSDEHNIPDQRPIRSAQRPEAGGGIRCRWNDQSTTHTRREHERRNCSRTRRNVRKLSGRGFVRNKVESSADRSSKTARNIPLHPSTSFHDKPGRD